MGLDQNMTVDAEGNVTASSACGHTIRAISSGTVGDHIYV
ncbi:hypothetical protein Sbal175_1838 [Shewanella baltica BA175]|nr:hypothetical protein Sbal175_1838 [Shewanella baltica BA175]